MPLEEPVTMATLPARERDGGRSEGGIFVREREIRILHVEMRNV